MDALYFPNLSLPSLAWTNPLVLYFDRIGIIAPSEYDARLSSPRTARLVEAGLVMPMFAGVFGNYEEEDAFVLETIYRNEDRRRGRQGRSIRLSRIHAGKLRETRLLGELIDRRILHYDFDDAQWLIGPENVCIQIMTVLAERIIRGGGAGRIVTNKAFALRVATGQVAPSMGEHDRRIRVVTSLLPVSPAASSEQLASFKQAHGPELRQFRAFVEQLIRRETDGEVFEARLRDAEQLREQLTGELDVMRAREGAGNFALIIGNIIAPLIEGSFFSGAMGFATGAGALRSQASSNRRRREIYSDGLAYAALAHSALRPRTSAEILA